MENFIIRVAARVRGTVRRHAPAPLGPTGDTPGASRYDQTDPTRATLESRGNTQKDANCGFDRNGIAPFHVDGDVAGFAITEEVAGGVVASEDDPVALWLDA